MTLDLLTDANAFYGDFDESGTYYPKGGGSRSIRMVILREVIEPLEENRSVTSPVIIVEVRNSATTGIASTEVDTGGDEIGLAVRVGKTATRRRITQILAHDAGTLRLELR